MLKPSSRRSVDSSAHVEICVTRQDLHSALGGSGSGSGSSDRSGTFNLRKAGNRVVASVDVGKVNMSVCVGEVRACLQADATPAGAVGQKVLARCEPHALQDVDRLVLNVGRSREDPHDPWGCICLQAAREASRGPPVLGESLPSPAQIRTAHPPLAVEWEGVWYVLRILRWGVYSLRSDARQARVEELTGQRCGTTEADADAETIKSLVPQLVDRASHWLDVWEEIGVTDVCIEEQVGMGGNASAAHVATPGAAASMAGNLTAKVLSHVLQALIVTRCRSGAAAWRDVAVHFVSPRKTNILADHLRGDKRAAKGVKTSQKKKYAVDAVRALMSAHEPPLAGVFARAKKKDDLADSLLQLIRFVRDEDGVPLKRAARAGAAQLRKSTRTGKGRAGGRAPATCGAPQQQSAARGASRSRTPPPSPPRAATRARRRSPELRCRVGDGDDADSGMCIIGDAETQCADDLSVYKAAGGCGRGRECDASAGSVAQLPVRKRGRERGESHSRRGREGGDERRRSRRRKKSHEYSASSRSSSPSPWRHRSRSRDRASHRHSRRRRTSRSPG